MNICAGDVRASISVCALPTYEWTKCSVGDKLAWVLYPIFIFWLVVVRQEKVRQIISQICMVDSSSRLFIYEISLHLRTSDGSELFLFGFRICSFGMNVGFSLFFRFLQ